MKMTRSQVINSIIRKHDYKTYLEIGVGTFRQPGYNWKNIDLLCKHGVDPSDKVNAVFKMTSDDFFARHVSMKYDLIFVDGLHIFEQVYRDIMNSVQWLSEGGTIVVHDCNPLLESWQHPVYRRGIWLGDVWKAILQLRMERSDLSIYVVDTDFGCGIIERGAQEVFRPNDPKADIYSFKFLDAHRKAILNLISVCEFKRLMGVESWFKFLPSMKGGAS